MHEIVCIIASSRGSLVEELPMGIANSKDPLYSSPYKGGKTLQTVNSHTELIEVANDFKYKRELSHDGQE